MEQRRPPALDRALQRRCGPTTFAFGGGRVFTFSPARVVCARGHARVVVVAAVVAVAVAGGAKAWQRLGAANPGTCFLPAPDANGRALCVRWAGIGRTGTLVGIDIGMASLEDTKYKAFATFLRGPFACVQTREVCATGDGRCNAKSISPRTGHGRAGARCAARCVPPPHATSCVLVRSNADVVNIVEAMRDGRGGMVQTPEQYAFVHRCLEDYAIMKNVGSAVVLPIGFAVPPPGV